MLEMFSTESFMNEEEVPQSAVVRVRRAKSKSFPSSTSLMRHYLRTWQVFRNCVEFHRGL
jgi:hypothetical protein